LPTEARADIAAGVAAFRLSPTQLDTAQPATQAALRSCTRTTEIDAAKTAAVAIGRFVAALLERASAAAIPGVGHASRFGDAAIHLEVEATEVGRGVAARHAARDLVRIASLGAAVAAGTVGAAARVAPAAGVAPTAGVAATTATAVAPRISAVVADNRRVLTAGVVAAADRGLGPAARRDRTQ
jgi:hypothetical protein